VGTIRAARYIRVSRADQSTGLQLDETEGMIARRGWTLADTYADHGVSGSRERRPELDRLMGDAHRRRVDVIVVWKADRLFRSTKAMITTLDEWANLGVDFVSTTEVFDSTTPQGRLLMQVTSAFAEFEKSLVVERTRAGIAAARRRGVHVGRPRVRLDDDELRGLRAEGVSVRKIAERLNIGVSTVQRRLAMGEATT
jgi:DNA invertase Pin-like site-specific DNA recombinase